MDKTCSRWRVSPARSRQRMVKQGIAKVAAGIFGDVGWQTERREVARNLAGRERHGVSFWAASHQHGRSWNFTAGVRQGLANVHGLAFDAKTSRLARHAEMDREFRAVRVVEFIQTRWRSLPFGREDSVDGTLLR